MIDRSRIFMLKIPNSGHPLYGIIGNTVKGDQLKQNTIGQSETKVETRVANSITLGSSLLALSVFGYTHGHDGHSHEGLKGK
jgi:hypothetical protein